MLDVLRPVVVIGGSSDRNQETAGAFQEFPQVNHAFIKFIFVACWCCNELTSFNLSSGGGVSALQQVLCQAQQPRGHPLSDREGNISITYISFPF